MTHARGHDAKGQREDPVRWARLDAEAWAKKGGRPPVAPVAGPSPGLEDLKQRYGISGAVATEDPDDPFIIVSRTSPNPDQFGPGVPLNVPQKKKLSDALADFYRKRGSELAELKVKLFQAGFYPGDVELDDIDFEDHDEESFNAYKRAIGRAAAYAEAGEAVSLEEVLSKVKPRSAKDGAKERERGPVTLSHPDDIIRGVEGVARKVIGRKLRPEERGSLVALWHALESRYQNTVDTAAPGQVVTKPPEFATFAEQQSERIDPAGAAEMDTIGVANPFFDLLDASGG